MLTDCSELLVMREAGTTLIIPSVSSSVITASASNAASATSPLGAPGQPAGSSRPIQSLSTAMSCGLAEVRKTTGVSVNSRSGFSS